MTTATRATDGLRLDVASSLARVTDRIADRDDLAADGAGEDRDTGGPDLGGAPDVGPGSRWARYRERRRTRVSKWDRPPQPHDWRFFVGTFGKVLITTGLLLFGFVAYQLWGTGIETARAQNRLEDAFEEAVAVVDEEPAPPTDTGVVDEPSGEDDGHDEDDQDDEEPDEGENAEEPPQELPEPAPSEVVPGGVDLSDRAVDQELPPIDRGDVVARLEIPKIDKDLYVVAGVTLDDLKDGPGHYDDTPLPGQLGNAAIAGHRTTYGAPFFDVDQLVVGDQLVVTLITGARYVYEVTGVEVVSASDYWVVTTRDPTVAELTLTSCHPKYTARDRIVVHSVLVPELSSPVGIAEPYELDATDTEDAAVETIPGDDPTVSSDDPTMTTDAPTGSTAPDEDPVDTEDDEVVVPVTIPVDDEQPAAPATESDPEPAPDAFAQGWFEDDDAWPQIALWAAALTIIALLAHQVSKRTRHTSIGFLAGVAPFLFCLYFFYQNVNRLLPPGL
jgi:sortase A